MRITQKVTLALGLAFVALCALFWTALQMSVAPQFTAFEFQKSQDNFERAQNVITRELNQLEAYRRDYGVWDDAYAFVKGDNPSFLKEELPLSLLQELNLNIYIYLSADGSLIDGVSIDGSMQKAVDIDAYAPVRFKNWRGFQATLAGDDAAQTIIKTKSGIMLAAYAPVTKTDGSGEYAGHLLTGRIVDADFLAALREQTRVEMTIELLDGAPELETVSAQTVERAGGFITVSAPVLGVDGAPVAELSARTPCDITVIGQRTIFSAFLWLTAAALLFIGIVSALLKRLAVRPIERLTALMTGAGTAKPAVDAELQNRKDEVGVLYASLNSLLDRIDRRTRDLAEALTAAESAERAKTQFLANMSHEIRTPMNGVMGMADLLANTKLTDVQRSFVNVIGKSGDALLTIINDILDFSKLDAGMANLNTAPFVLADVVEDVSALIAARANAKNIEMAVRIDPELPFSFVGDAGRLRQILINLAGNAVKFTDKGYVLVDVSPATDPEAERVGLKFSVIDTGMGIAEHKCAQVFEKFSQADASTTRAHEGTGLGLAIAKALVELMGGEIGVESKAGAGSTFWFKIALEVNTREIPGAIETEDIAGTRLLIVDDNAVNRRILEEQSAAWGCPAESCNSGEDALARLKEAHDRGECFDAVIMDYQMPGMNGAETVRRIKAEPAIGSISVLMLTSVDHVDAGDEFEALGITAHLTKPARSAALQRAIGRAVHGPRGDTSPEPAHSLPPSEREQPGATSTSATTSTADAVDILVAEDNEVNRLVVSHILRAAGYSYDMAVNGYEAVEKFKALKPKIILMDVSMPRMSGYDATAEIRRIEETAGLPRTPIIGVTAHAVKGDCNACYEAGMDDYAPKPITPATLTAKIAEHIAAAAANAA